MKATILDLRRNPRKVLEAIERNEAVTLSRRGREIARIVPRKGRTSDDIRGLAAFGIWKDRAEMADPPGYVGRIRRGRFGDL